MIDPVRLRREADFVLKNLRSPDDAQAIAAAGRFKRLPRLSELTPEELRRRAASVRRSDALDLIALEHGLRSWSEVAQKTGSSAGPGPSTPSRHCRTRLPKPPTPEQLAQRVAERVLYFAEPLPPQCGGGQRLDLQRVREETLVAILDALRGEQVEIDKKAESAQ
jgi:hypothetical protein